MRKALKSAIKGQKRTNLDYYYNAVGRVMYRKNYRLVNLEDDKVFDLWVDNLSEIDKAYKELQWIDNYLKTRKGLIYNRGHYESIHKRER